MIMKKYEDFKKDKKERDLTDEEIKSIDWTRYKIVVPTKNDKVELMSAFEHIHYSDIDTDFITVNQLVHEYLNGDNILISEEIFNVLNKNGK